jgi:hypothetical protein
MRATLAGLRALQDNSRGTRELLAMSLAIGENNAPAAPAGGTKAPFSLITTRGLMQPSSAMRHRITAPAE